MPLSSTRKVKKVTKRTSNNLLHMLLYMNYYYSQQTQNQMDVRDVPAYPCSIAVEPYEKRKLWWWVGKKKQQ